MKIRTENQTYGWVAVDDDRYDGPGSHIGAGRTEREALADLIEQLEGDYSYDLEAVKAAKSGLNQRSKAMKEPSAAKVKREQAAALRRMLRDSPAFQRAKAEDKERSKQLRTLLRKSRRLIEKQDTCRYCCGTHESSAHDDRPAAFETT